MRLIRQSNGEVDSAGSGKEKTVKILDISSMVRNREIYKHKLEGLNEKRFGTKKARMDDFGLARG